MLYIDNPVGTGFSFTDEEEGFPTSDEEVAEYLIEAMRQFMLVYPVSIHLNFVRRVKNKFTSSRKF
jgi:hypothetical protein